MIDHFIQDKCCSRTNLHFSLTHQNTVPSIHQREPLESRAFSAASNKISRGKFPTSKRTHWPHLRHKANVALFTALPFSRFELFFNPRANSRIRWGGHVAICHRARRAARTNKQRCHPVRIYRRVVPCRRKHYRKTKSGHVPERCASGISKLGGAAAAKWIRNIAGRKAAANPPVPQLQNCSLVKADNSRSTEF